MPDERGQPGKVILAGDLQHEPAVARRKPFRISGPRSPARSLMDQKLVTMSVIATSASSIGAAYEHATRLAEAF